jgi:hypothetical protein
MVNPLIAKKCDDLAQSDARIIAMAESNHSEKAANAAIEIQMMQSMRAHNPNAKLVFFFEQSPIAHDKDGKSVELQNIITKYLQGGQESELNIFPKEEDRQILREAKRLNFTVICIDDDKTDKDLTDALNAWQNYGKDHRDVLRNFRDPNFREVMNEEGNLGLAYAKMLDSVLDTRNTVMATRLGNIMDGSNAEEFYKGVVPAGGFDRALMKGGTRHIYFGNDVNEKATSVGKIAVIELAYMRESADLILEKPKAFFEDLGKTSDKPDAIINVWQNPTEMPKSNGGNNPPNLR